MCDTAPLLVGRLGQDSCACTTVESHCLRFLIIILGRNGSGNYYFWLKTDRLKKYFRRLCQDSCACTTPAAPAAPAPPLPLRPQASGRTQRKIADRLVLPPAPAKPTAAALAAAAAGGVGGGGDDSADDDADEDEEEGAGPAAAASKAQAQAQALGSCWERGAARRGHRLTATSVAVAPDESAAWTSAKDGGLLR